MTTRPAKGRRSIKGANAITRTRRRDALRAGIGVAAVLVMTSVLIFFLSRTERGGDSAATTTTSRSLATTSTTLDRQQRRDQATAQAFRQRMQAVFVTLVGRFPSLAKDLDEFDKGTLDAQGFLSVHGSEVDLAVAARDQMPGLEGFPGDRRPKDLYTQASMLYAEAFRDFVDAAHVDPPLRHQVVLSGKRVRVLADRVFDRGSRIVETLAHDPPNPDLEVHLPEEVPNWRHEGFAAGPPVGTVVDNKVTIDESKAKRPAQSIRTWTTKMAKPVAAVQRAARIVLELETDGPVADAQRVADELERASEQTRVIADPRGGREAFATLRLAVLVEAESARSFALARAAVDARSNADVVASLRTRGRDLAIIAASLWSAAAHEIGAPKTFVLPPNHFDDAGLKSSGATTTTLSSSTTQSGPPQAGPPQSGPTPTGTP